MRSKTVMAGYLDDPELTSETIVDGWLMTGDIGNLTSEGSLVILGRKKELIKTSYGKCIYSGKIEGMMIGLVVGLTILGITILGGGV